MNVCDLMVTFLRSGLKGKVTKKRVLIKASELKQTEEVEKMDRPITTLFMLMSVDGKISTGVTDELDVDRDG